MISAFIQGYSPVLPFLFILFIALISLLISWWSYKELTSVSLWKKWTLITLRTSALGLLILLLFNPYLIREFTDTESPKIAVYLDNSESLSINRREYRGMESYEQIIDQFRSAEDDRFHYQYFLFDEDIYDESQISLTGTSTNIQLVMEHIKENESTYSLSVLFTDGIVNHGRNPLFTAQTLSTPIIVFPVGDSTRVRDISISDVDYNVPMFTNTRNLITAEVQQEGFEGEEITVQLLENGELADTQSIVFSATRSSHLVEFFRTYSDPGFYVMEVNVPPKEGEFTDRNNSTGFNLEVIDDKTRILSLAFEIHPDVGSVRRLIASDQQNELIMSTYVGNNRFTGEDPRELVEDLDLIVLHGLPDLNSPLFNWISERDEPILYISKPESYRILLNADESVFNVTNFRLESAQTLLSVNIGSASVSRTHPLLEYSQTSLNRLPTLQSYQGSYVISPASETLLKAEYRMNETNIPILTVKDTGNRRTASVNAYGWHRYENSRQDEARLFFRELFKNLIAWSSTPPDRRTLVLEPRKSSFSENEPVEIRATLTNERGEPESNALVELYFYENDQEDGRTFRMSAEGNGIYSASIGNFPRGIYRAEAMASVNNRTLGEAETRVNVNRSNLEMVNTQRDDGLLQQIASVTNGLFSDVPQSDILAGFYDDRNLDEPREETTIDINYLYQTGLWFFAVIILLSAEWLIRRSVSLP
jgi:hypothetical protein